MTFRNDMPEFRYQADQEIAATPIKYHVTPIGLHFQLSRMAFC